MLHQNIATLVRVDFYVLAMIVTFGAPEVLSGGRESIPTLFVLACSERKLFFRQHAVIFKIKNVLVVVYNIYVQDAQKGLGGACMSCPVYGRMDIACTVLK